MSRFDDLFAAAAAPLLMDWFGGCVEYRAIDLAADVDGIKIKLAIVGDEKKHRRRSGDYETELVTVRTISIITQPNVCNYSGVRSPRQNAKVVITEAGETKTYQVEEVLTGAGGFTDLQLKRIARVAMGSRESLGE